MLKAVLQVVMKVKMGVKNMSPRGVPGKFPEAFDQNASCVGTGTLGNALHFYIPSPWHRACHGTHSIEERIVLTS